MRVKSRQHFSTYSKYVINFNKNFADLPSWLPCLEVESSFHFKITRKKRDFIISLPAALWVIQFRFMSKKVGNIIIIEYPSLLEENRVINIFHFVYFLIIVCYQVIFISYRKTGVRCCFLYSRKILN